MPLDGIVEDDGELVVPYDAALVRDAPAIDPDAALDEAEQDRLARRDAMPANDADDDRDDRESQADRSRPAELTAHRGPGRGSGRRCGARFVPQFVPQAGWPTRLRTRKKPANAGLFL
ncbi:hypothetical protein [Baekduia alba]|uniref:hypothetical protein n=1 Tax=Baekduia alba TaxID=2997333 RepID=UPI00234264A9|nr:hypothetical protein [Baekduia alba]